MLENASCTFPLMTSGYAAPMPRYGTCVISMPAASLIISPARCGAVPTPGEIAARGVDDAAGNVRQDQVERLAGMSLPHARCSPAFAIILNSRNNCRSDGLFWR